MDKLRKIRTRSVLFLSVAMLLPAFGQLDRLYGADFEASANPFDSKKLGKEPMSARMRHPFHKIRTTWVDYFKVWPKPTDDHQKVTLNTVRGEPIFFQQRQVDFKVYFNARGSFFRQHVSPFHKDHYVNFSAWAHGTNLWDPNGRKNIYPLLYVKLKHDKLIRKMDKFKRYEPMRIWGRVTIVTENEPWIEITDIDHVKEPPHTLTALRDLELAWKLMNNQMWEMANAKFHSSLEKSLPHHTQQKVLHAMGVCYMATGQYASAREAFIEALKRYGHDRIQLKDALLKTEASVPALLKLAQVDLRLNHNEEARTAAEIAIKLKPFSSIAHAERGLALAKLGHVQRGLRSISAAEKLAAGKLAEANRNRAQIYILLDKWLEAEKEMALAIVLRTGDVGYHLELGDIYLALKDNEKAQAQFVEANRLGSELPLPLHRLALTLKIRGDGASDKNAAKAYYESALKKIEECHDVDNRFVPAYKLHAEILRALGRAEDAKKVLEQGAKAVPGNLSMLDELYKDAKTQGDWARMETAAMGALLVEPKTAQRHYVLGTVLLGKSEAPDLAAAESEFAIAASLDPSHADAWAQLARLRTQQQNWRSAAVAAEKGVALNAGAGSVWGDLGTARLHLGDWNGSVNAFEKAFQLENGLVEKMNLAQAYLVRRSVGDQGKAISLAKLAVVDAKDGVYKSRANGILAGALQLGGQTKEALSAIKKIDGHEGAWVAMVHADSLLADGAYDNAETQYRSAVSEATADQTQSRLFRWVRSTSQKGLNVAEKFKRELAIRRSVDEKSARKKEMADKKKLEDEKPKKKDEDSKFVSKVNQPPVIEVKTNDQAADVEPEVEAR